MAYVDDQEEKDQASAQKPQSDFDITQPVSSSAPASSQASQDNANSYEQSFSGGGASSSSTPKSPNTNSTGLGSNTPGGGFVNFEAYGKANPSEATNISDAADKLVSSESSAWDKQRPGDLSSGFSADPNGAPTMDTADSAATTDLSSGSFDPSKWHGWMNETYTAPDVSYTPSKDWQTYAPELSETNSTGVGGKPSVLDYLARDNIAAGNYTGGERSLDQAIIGGDRDAQQAIKDSATKFGNLQTSIADTVASLKGQEGTDTQRASDIAAAATKGLEDAGNTITSGLNANVSAANAGPSAQTIADRDAAVQAYADWMKGGGPQEGGIWTPGTVTPQTTATPENMITKDQATTMNRIAEAKGLPDPYPDLSKVGGGVTPEIITGGGGSYGGSPPLTTSSTDPSDAGASAIAAGSTAGFAGVAPPPPISVKYSNIIADPKLAGHSESWMTPAESAVLQVMHPESAQFYPPMTAKDLQAGIGQLRALSADPTVNHASKMYQNWQTELKAALAKLATMGTETQTNPNGNASPYAYGLSLGLTPEQLAQAGFVVPDNAGAAE